ncbi:methylmalonyl-CoA epimerase [Myxococcota bacterium]|nr:methylmalonyl-CoA epimerase [Myxococcota bacterium]MBU1433240.1 methylmalonyl-CoA epimerase [Myxococcota bacterium]MBU1898906.1 methylmalonyl-CoA epimerase [Myxococcota bacterium]
MEPRFKKIDHIGIAVPDLSQAMAMYEALLGAPATHTEEVASQKVRVAFFEVGESHLELLEPTAEDSPIAGFLAQRRGGIHHLCVEVEDIEATLRAYKAAGVKLIDEAPRPGAHGKRVAFVHPKSTGGVLLELSQRAEP